MTALMTVLTLGTLSGTASAAAVPVPATPTDRPG
jgi:hypothetical protein